MIELAIIFCMKIILMIIGILLILNGFINILDDGVILAYDITSALSGVGFILISVYLRKV